MTRYVLITLHRVVTLYFPKTKRSVDLLPDYSDIALAAYNIYFSVLLTKIGN